MSVVPHVEKFNIVRTAMNTCTSAIFPFQPEIRFWANLDKKSQNCQFKLKFGSKSNSNMQNSIVIVTFSVLDQKHTFWANLVQKIKIVSLS